jgi:hypothetical protein
VDVAALLAGLSGQELSGLSDFALDELGVPCRMRAHLRTKLLAPPAAPPVDEQVAAAEAQGRELLRTSTTRAGNIPPLDADADADARAPAGAPPGSAPAPPWRAASGTVLAPPSQLTAQLAAGFAGALAATAAFVGAERAKRERGETTTADTMTTSVALPYAWAAASASFGLEWVKKALEVGEGVPMVGAVFTLCLIVAQSAETAVANRAAAALLAALAQRCAGALLGADAETLSRVETSVGALQAALKDAVELIQSYAARGWLRRIAAAGGDAARFRALHERIREEMATLSFDLQISTPTFRDESKPLRAVVLAQTGRTVEEGGLEELLRRPGGSDALRSTLGVDAQVLSCELGDIAASLQRVGSQVSTALDLQLARELRGAVQLNVSLTQPSKRAGGGVSVGGMGGATFLQQADVRERSLLTGGVARRVAAFRVLTGHVIECALAVDSRDNTELRVKAIERVEQADAVTYTPAATAAQRRRCWCGGARGADARALLLSPFGPASAEAQLFEEDDVDLPLAAPRTALLELRLPEDAGPAGEVLTLNLRIWISFHPAPALGEGFAQGKTVPVVQTLYLAVYKKGSTRFQLREMEDAATLARAGVARIGAPVLALPLLVHTRYVRSTEALLRRQLVGWADGTAIEVR